jgi:predicted  nucleic acid-binding Zn-ribbon protein
MKKTTLGFAIILIIGTISLPALGQQNKKAEKARKDMAKAKIDLQEAKIDSVADYQKFKNEADLNIAANQKTIAELRTKKADDNKELKEKYDKQVMALEDKNEELKKRIDGSAHVKTSKWSSFKQEFNHDMNELGRAIRDIGVNNMK